MQSLILNNTHNVLKHFMFRGGFGIQEILQNRAENDVACRHRFWIDVSSFFGPFLEPKSVQNRFRSGLGRPLKRDSVANLNFIGFVYARWPPALQNSGHFCSKIGPKLVRNREKFEHISIPKRTLNSMSCLG